ncbi:MAG: hypothetical protein NTW74_04380, partial [Acidobacteria bacterium]|nr:hypothetical protein [Acidobacteriota bacterium]
AQKGCGLVDAVAGKTLHSGQSVSMKTKGSDDIPPERRCLALWQRSFGFTWISAFIRSKGSNFF